MLAPAARSSQSHNPWLVCAAAWIVPGGGHLLLGRVGKGFVLLVTLVVMFTTGLLLKGRIFPFELSDPLVALAAIANMGIGAPYLVALGLGSGVGDVLAVTFEYGNSFAIVAGLLNMLVVLDAYDMARGLK
jgi:hypothetical protein